MSRPRVILSPDELWPRVAEITRRAHAGGTLVPILTSPVVVEDGGVPFVVHVRAGVLERKRAERRDQDRSGVNPFLPPDPALLVGPVSASHLAVLNKFNVIDHHVLLVTRKFVPQDAPLDLADAEALARAMAGSDCLGFYNGGTVGGASQPHKHLQLIPLPLGPGPEPTPIDTVVGRGGPTGSGVGRIPGLPFAHAVVRLTGAPIRADQGPRLLALARELLGAVGARDTGRPYNLLLTRRWAMAVPRVLEHAEGISVNSLGFAGSLFARNEDQLERLRRRGPMQLLVDVAGPAGG